MLLLEPTALAAYIFIALLVVAFVQSIRSYRRLSHIPGPRFAAFSKLWLLRVLTAGRSHRVFVDLYEQSGPVVRISPDTVLLGDPEEWRRICAPRSPYRRGEFYSAFRFKPRTDSVVTERDEEKHEILRKKMAAGYSGKENHSLEQSVDNRILDLIDLIERKYLSDDSQSKYMDLARIIQFFTLDVISDIAFSNPFGNLVKNEDSYEYIKIMGGAMRFMNLVSAVPLLRKILELRVMDFLAPSTKDATGLGPIFGVARREISTRFGPDKKEQWDMLGSFVRHGLDQEEAESETVLQILAGSDTTATAIRNTMLHIITAPDVLSRMRQEFEKTSSPIQFADAKELPYLQAVIKEGLRMLPPVISLQDKLSPPGGDVISGYRIPEGVNVGFNVMAFQRNPLFGPDTDVFRPSRWLIESREQLAKMERTVDLVFSAGRFVCLGRNLAIMELNKIFVELFRRFDFALVNPSAPWDNKAYAIFVTKDMWVRVTKRVQNGKY
ncbi:MAG: hypothetical protein Q9160_001016 [Pyrenula sp. 1 TL-2023]